MSLCLETDTIALFMDSARRAALSPRLLITRVKQVRLVQSVAKLHDSAFFLCVIGFPFKSHLKWKKTISLTVPYVG